ncbi:MAG: 3'(2'),5'-bisphosphate nucleotidase CysQ [Magnetococcus sp. DMHC-6]
MFYNKASKDNPLTDTSLNADLQLMVTAARQAGTITMRYHRPGETLLSMDQMKDKGQDNPLTKADLEADHLLRTLLLGQRPEYGWLSEETVDDPIRLQKSKVWVVDPIDGTKEFIMGLPQFAVSIALIDQNQPIAACVFNPAADELYTAILGQGAALNGHPIQTTSQTTLLGSSCLASLSETKRGEWEGFKETFNITTMGSIAYKLALVAAGRYDLTFTLSPKNEWDFAAGELLVRAAGGKVTDLAGQTFRFNQTNPLTNAVVASNGLLHQALLTKLENTPLWTTKLIAQQESQSP